MPNDIKIGMIDYLIKVACGDVTFGLIVTALRGRFERKYHHIANMEFLHNNYYNYLIRPISTITLLHLPFSP
jgi:hypothetical protein